MAIGLEVAQDRAANPTTVTGNVDLGDAIQLRSLTPVRACCSNIEAGN